MTLDTSALIGLVSLVVSLILTAFGTGVKIGRHKERIERFAEEFKKYEQNKNDRR